MDGPSAVIKRCDITPLRIGRSLPNWQFANAFLPFMSLEVRVRVQGRDGLQEMSVRSDATADEFVAEAQEAGIVPRSGVCNVVVRNQSGVRINGGDRLATALGGGFADVVWDEYDPKVESLCNMGFEREAAAAALRDSDGCIEMAVGLLVCGGDLCSKGSSASDRVRSQDQSLATSFDGSSRELLRGLIEEVTAQLKVYVDNGYPKSQYVYGSILEPGLGCAVNLAQAAHWYKAAADQGLAEAQYKFAYCLENGQGVDLDLASAARYYKLAADQGFAPAQFNFAHCLHEGHGVDVDLASAARYYKLAADQGLAEAQLVYGLLCCHFELGRVSDHNEAVKWFKLAAGQGNITAMWCLGVCLYMGKGIDMNCEKAVSQFLCAAQLGDSFGQFCYGLAMFESNDCSLEEDSDEWIYLLQSADNGCNDAAVIIGLQHFANFHNFQEPRFRRAFEQQDLCALYNYGVFMLRNDNLTSKDVCKIVRCFRVVAEQWGDGAEYDYHRFLRKGIGFDSPERWRIVLVECEQGQPESQFIYGKYLYSQGKRDDALQYFFQSTSWQHADAKFACGALLYYELRRPLREVRHYFEEASNDGILVAQYTYGRILTSEERPLEERRQGLKYLSMAAKEVLLRRQCRDVRVSDRPGMQPFEFFYSPIPSVITPRATDNYINEHLLENLWKLQLSWYEISHPKVRVMKPQQLKGASYNRR